MAEWLANLLIGVGGGIVATSTLVQSLGVGLLSGEGELKEIRILMEKRKTQAEANKIIKDSNSRLGKIYTGAIFIGAIMMAVGGLYK